MMRVKISGMSCPNCVKHVREALLAIPGVREAEVDLECQEAIVTYDDDNLVQKIVETIEEEGYQAVVS